ncbi:MAG: aldehyde dehydrogenase family protein [Chloroflexi bacterium]|nr:aldehyde dehydrogenase family protein [Chloroflexota bacterium]
MVCRPARTTSGSRRRGRRRARTGSSFRFSSGLRRDGRWLRGYTIRNARRPIAQAVAHGCTGKGNDQVRFDVSVQALAPDLRIVAPVREWELRTREQEIDYAKKHKIPVPVTKESPYSIDENLWGRSVEAGDHICRNAGIKKVTMELGSNSPLIIMPDADLEKVAAATVASGFANAGQVCISTQRVFADRSIYADFLDALVAPTEAFITGNPLDESIKMGPMIRESDASRVQEWIAEAVGQGARIVAGGDREGTLHAPTVVADATRDMRISKEELFGPAVAKFVICRGELFPARKAALLGLVHEVASDAEFPALLQQQIDTILKRSPAAIRTAKRLIADITVASGESAFELEAESFGECYESPDAAEGIAVFLEKRPPEWS